MALKPIAYVQASWHTDVTDHCRTAFMAELARHGYAAGDVELFSVPGSLEIPLMARKLARTGHRRCCRASCRPRGTCSRRAMSWRRPAWPSSASSPRWPDARAPSARASH